MASRFIINCINQTLQDFYNNDSRPFSGKVVVFCGDFRQILLVIPSGNQYQVITASIKYAKCQLVTRILRLRINMRLSTPNLTDQRKQQLVDFANRLLYISKHGGEVAWNTQRYVIASNTSTALTVKIFLLGQVYLNDHLIKSAVLTARNNIVDSLNNQLID